MIKSTGRYVQQLSNAFGEAWNRFWFTPSDPATVSAMRLLTGLVVVYLHATLSWDLVAFFGPHGLLPAVDISPLEGNTISYMNGLSTPTELWAVHLLGLVVLVAFAVGFWTRVTSVLALIVFLSVVNRAPMITGCTESVLAVVMLYLCLAPCGQRFSIDAWLAARKGTLLGGAPPGLVDLGHDRHAADSSPPGTAGGHDGVLSTGRRCVVEWLGDVVSHHPGRIAAGGLHVDAGRPAGDRFLDACLGSL